MNWQSLISLLRFPLIRSDKFRWLSAVAFTLTFTASLPAGQAEDEDPFSTFRCADDRRDSGGVSRELAIVRRDDGYELTVSVTGFNSDRTASFYRTLVLADGLSCTGAVRVPTLFRCHGPKLDIEADITYRPAHGIGYRLRMKGEGLGELRAEEWEEYGLERTKDGGAATFAHAPLQGDGSGCVLRKGDSIE